MLPDRLRTVSLDRSGTGANKLHAPIPVLLGFVEAIAVRDAGRDLHYNLLCDLDFLAFTVKLRGRHLSDEKATT